MSHLDVTSRLKMSHGLTEITNLKKTIGQRVKRLRGNLTQHQLAKLCGVDRTIIGNIERASKDYRIDSLLHVVVAIDADVRLRRKSA